MSATLVIDDLFITNAYSRFLEIYEEVYGDAVKKPLSYEDITRAAQALLGKKISATHVFYLPDRMSSFLMRHVGLLARAHLMEKAPTTDGLSADDVPEYPDESFIEDVLGLKVRALLRKSSDPTFHAAEWVGLEASTLLKKTDEAILVADDLLYQGTETHPSLTYVRLGNEFTSMPGNIRWQDAAYLFCKAYHVEP